MRRPRLAAGWILLLAAASGCAPPRTERPVTLHYTDSQRMFLIPLARTVEMPREDRKALEEVLETLQQAPSSHLRSPLASGSHTQVRSLRTGHLELDVTRTGATTGSGGEQLMVAALVKTAASVTPLEDVRIRLLRPDGKPTESTHMDLDRPFSPSDPSMENLYQGGENTGLAVQVYFPLFQDSLLVPLRTPLPAEGAREPLRGAFMQWLQGPPEDLASFLGPSHSSATRFGWAGIRDHEATIIWQNAPDATPSAESLKSLVLTMTEQANVHSVRLMTPTGPARGQIGPFDLARPMGRPAHVNDWPGSTR